MRVPRRGQIRSRIRWSVVATVLALIPASPAHAGVAVLDGAAKSRAVEVIVQFKDGVDEANARATIRAYRGRPGVSLPIISAMSARMRAAQARHLSRNHRVRAVTINRPVESTSRPDVNRLATVFNQAVNSNDVWPKATGAGVGVAVIDTGIAGDLPDFATSSADSTSRVVASVVTNPFAKTAGDGYGHGTHVAGVIAGNGASRPTSDGLYSRYAGVAPDADLISVKVSDERGNASVLDVLTGMMFVLEHRDDLNIRVLNLSLQSAAAGSYKTDPLDLMAEVAWKSGIVVVTAAGNRGTAADAVQYAPANDPFVITVGAEDDRGTPTIWDDTIASWSSRGTTQDGYTKPDIYAPGVRIVSLLAPGSAFASMCPSCIIDGGYIRASGTSMAAPVVAGAAAVLLQLHPDWTPDQIKGAIVNTAERQRDGTREVDVLNASRAAGNKLVANVGLTPAWTYWSQAVPTTTTSADPNRSSWSRSSWSAASGDLAAPWARSSWSCVCSPGANDGVDPERSSWSRSSWSNLFER